MDEKNPVITTADLAEKLGMPETMIRQRMKQTNKSYATVDWQTYPPTSHLHRMMVLLKDMRQALQTKPFIDDQTIVVLLGDQSAFLFDLKGKAIPDVH